MVCSMQLFLAQEPWFIAALLCAGIMAKESHALKTDPELPLAKEKPIALLKTLPAMKAAAMNTKGKVKGKGKPKAKARAKGKPKAKAAAAAKQKAMKKPAASWDSWAEQKEADGDGEEEEEGEYGKDYSAPTKAQAFSVDQALEIEPGSRGALPKDIHDLWATLQKGPGAVKERHALRNAIVPKDAKYGHVCKVDQDGPLMKRIRTAFEIKQKNIQVKGMSESEMLWSSFHGNAEAMNRAIEKGHIKVKDDMFFWTREFHEHITGGKDSYSTGPQAMTQDDMQKLLELLNYAPWANWAVSPNNVPKPQLKNMAGPESDAIKKAHECLAASQTVCAAMQNFYRMVQSESILRKQDTGSIPTIMSNAMRKMKDMENEHLQPIAELCYDPDGTSLTSVKDVRGMLSGAARALQSLTQYMNEAKALVQKYKAAQAKNLSRYLLRGHTSQRDR